MKHGVILIAAFLALPFTLADGMIHIQDQDMWHLGLEGQQYAAINYEDGHENMLISVDLDEKSGQKAVWIFPVPASPESVQIDVLQGFPQLYGSDIDKDYKGAVLATSAAMTGYSLFPVSIPVVFAYAFVGSKLGSLGAFDRMEDVTIFGRVEKMGLATELITAKDTAALSRYLQEKGLSLPDGSNAALQDYIGKDYSLVVSYIEDLEEYLKQKPEDMYYGRNADDSLGVFVRFPTDEMYFPLKLTSVYDQRQVPIVVYVMDHATPRLYPGIEDKTSIAYYHTKNYHVDQNVRDFFNGKEFVDRFAYTKIRIDAPASSFTDDLWIEDSAPVSVAVKAAIARYFWIGGIILYIVFSITSSLIAGSVAFRKDGPSSLRLALQGLWNLLGLIGFVIAVFFMSTQKLDSELERMLKARNLSVTVRDRRKLGYTLLFYATFIAQTTIVAVLLLVGLA